MSSKTLHGKPKLLKLSTYMVARLRT